MARQLKYHSPNTDLAALQRELAGSDADGQAEELEEFEEYGDDDGDTADDGRWDPPRRR